MKVRQYFTFLCLLVLTCISVVAQTVSVAKISGTVTDGNGAVIVGAEVTATATDTGLTRTAKTGNDGYYLIPSLPVGNYTVQAGMASYSTQVRSNVVLQVDTNPTLNFKLSPGSITEEVRVDASAPMVETQNVSVGLRCGQPED